MFPIAGALDFDDISQRLSSIRIPEKGFVLVLQIRFVDNLDLLSDLLVHLALFRVFISGSNVFILPPKCDLYIELGNTFDHMFETKLIYRKHVEVRQKTIEKFDLGVFEVSQNFQNEDQIRKDDVQYICNNLLHYQQSLINNQLAAEEINYKTLTQQQCI